MKSVCDDGSQDEHDAGIAAYQGIQYQYMAPDVFEEGYFSYVQKHLRILSGFYGILKPFDGIVPYRLEMQARLKALSARTCMTSGAICYIVILSKMTR